MHWTLNFLSRYTNRIKPLVYWWSFKGNLFSLYYLWISFSGFYISFYLSYILIKRIMSSTVSCDYNLNHLNSLGPRSAVGEKGKKRGQTGKNIGKRSEPSVILRRGKGRHHPFSSPEYLSARFARQLFFSPGPDFFSFFPQCGAWSQATSEKHWRSLLKHVLQNLRMKLFSFCDA